MTRFGLFSILLALLSSTVWGQDRQVKPLASVKVIEHFNGQPIGWASLWSYEEGRQRVLNVSYAKPDGSISWRAPKPGTYKLVFRADGYMADSVVVALTADTTLTAIRLYPDWETPAYRLEAATVTADRPLMTQMFDRLVYDVSRDPEAKKKKMTEIIEKIPQVNSLTADGRLEYRG